MPLHFNLIYFVIILRIMKLNWKDKNVNKILTIRENGNFSKFPKEL